ncbi:hypothetical protein SAMN05216353_109118 [Halobacillus alkaliphilus]|uniref:Uncharacterized protein n=1 Tax=Halobacillus alkaliphilus TaxID=396056 RepID=A0A1I2LLZ3_9BACI|nr:hypothetical protein [Halobacillus alkaliphilus]SFF80552.1 hypothetical protein SAMN05216353_109118 [Halobacillus alkaliphilus]
MVEEFGDFTNKYTDHHDGEEHWEGGPDEQGELCLGDASEQEKSDNQDFPETDEDCVHDLDKHYSNMGFDDLSCKSVGEVLNLMFQFGDHLEVFFEDEMVGRGGTFVETIDNIIIWMDCEENCNITDLRGPISIKKIGTKRNPKHKNEKNTNHTCDNQNDKKKKDKAENKEKGSRNKNVKNDQSGVNEELLNFVRLEKEGEINLYIEESSNDSEEGEKYTPQLETEEFQSEEKN